MTSASRTEVGVVMGTPAYMSPEQTSGPPTRPSHRYFFSRRPASRDGDRAQAVRRNFFGRVGLRDSAGHAVSHDVRPGLPSDLARIVRRCLKKDPRHRLQTARDVSNEFRDLARTASRPTSVSAAAPRMATPSDSDAARVDGGFWVAVLPLKYSGSNQDLRALAEGLSEEIVTGLSRFSYLRVMVHHGGRISVMTGLMAGTPAVIIPTITERVSNARRLAAVGAGEVVMPVAGADGEKRIDVAEFGRKVSRVLSQPSYHQSARRVAESMRQFGGADAAAERIEEFAVALGL